MIDTSAERLVTLANQWEKHRVPLIEQFRDFKEHNAGRVVSIYFCIFEV